MDKRVARWPWGPSDLAEGSVEQRCWSRGQYIWNTWKEKRVCGAGIVLAWEWPKAIRVSGLELPGRLRLIRLLISPRVALTIHLGSAQGALAVLCGQ